MSIGIGIGVLSVLAVAFIVWVVNLRVIVPTNVVHIIQRSKSTVSYGYGLPAGNVYYVWPSWIPILGVSVRSFPVSNFDLDLDSYEAYDRDRVPFMVDIKAFFRISDTNTAAAKVSNFEELHKHLTGIVQGAVRSIMAKSDLESIMSERSIYCDAFTKMCKDQLSQWGVEAVKNIELMDIKDVKDSLVIANIMAKKKSEIEKDSRIVVALNRQKAENSEIEAAQVVEIRKTEADQLVKIRRAEAEKLVGEQNAAAKQAIGVAEERSKQAVNDEAKVTKEKEMEVVKVSTVRQQDIQKEAAIIDAEQKQRTIEIGADADKAKIIKQTEAEKYKTEQLAEAMLRQREAEAKGITLTGTATAEAEKASQLASVTAQTELAKSVGDNQGYQQYLITIENIKATRDIGVEQAKNLGHANIKIISNAGNVSDGIKSAGEFFSPKGGTGLAGMVEGFAQSDIGKQIIGKFSEHQEKS